MSKTRNMVSSVPPVGPAYDTWYAMHGDGVGWLEGRLLTLIDASIADQEQRKALKDILRQTVWDWAMNQICRVEYEDVKFVHYNEKGMKDGFEKNPELQTKG